MKRGKRRGKGGWEGKEKGKEVLGVEFLKR